MKKYCLQILLVTICIKLLSQSDTLHLDTNASLECKYDTVYKIYLEDKEKQINRLWKIALLDFDYEGNVGNFNFRLEQGIGKYFSSYSYIRFINAKYNQSDISGDRYADDNYFGTVETLEIGSQFRYYWNYNNREKRGRKINGFSADYLAFNLDFSKCQYHFNGTGSTIDTDKYSYSAGLIYGFQRRIGNIGYFDFYTGIEYASKYEPRTKIESGETILIVENKKGFFPFVGLHVGFAIDAFSNVPKLFK